MNDTDFPEYGRSDSIFSTSGMIRFNSLSLCVPNILSITFTDFHTFLWPVCKKFSPVTVHR